MDQEVHPFNRRYSVQRAISFSLHINILLFDSPLGFVDSGKKRLQASGFLFC